MSGPSEVQKQITVFQEGAVDLISEAELKELLASSLAKKRPLRIKYGADPSSPDLHLGHTVPLRRLRAFQELGHTVVFIIGDFTARIGDPAHRSETRKMLSPDEVKRHALTYQDQVFKILDRSKTEVRYNSEWLDGMTSAEFLNLTSQYTIARLLERDDFKKRYEAQTPIALIELMYPLLQGYDSVQVKADVEIGGTDQKFNLLVGRELQRTWGDKPQIVITYPLIEGTDGVWKMSKSLNNHIALLDSPEEMFGKMMSIPDALMERYWRCVSGAGHEEVAKVLKDLKSGTLHPREGKARLAEEIVALYHSRARARSAHSEFDRIFRDKGLPSEIPAITVQGKEWDVVSLLKEAGLVASKGEARRLIAQGGVRLEHRKVESPDFVVSLKAPVLIQCGKRKFARVSSDAK